MKKTIIAFNNRIVQGRTMYFILTLLWITLIFSFSLQPGSVSSELSSGFGKWLVEVFLSGFIGNGEPMSAEQWELMHFLLRKAAHFTEYFVLGILVRLTVSHMRVQHKFIFAMTTCIAVASTDETIQRFVSGRSGQISDVLLDSVGALCGIGIMMWLGKRHRWTKKCKD